MSKTEVEIAVMIDAMDKKLKETKESFGAWNSGPVSDTLKVVIPMMEDQLEIIREFLARAKE